MVNYDSSALSNQLPYDCLACALAWLFCISTGLLPSPWSPEALQFRSITWNVSICSGNNGSRLSSPAQILSFAWVALLSAVPDIGS